MTESRLSAEVLEGFINSVLRRNFDEPAETGEFHREMWRYICSPNTKVAIAAPRSHAKSTVVTHAYILASALFRDQSYIIIVSDTATQSTQFLGDIKKELLENDDLRNLFGVRGLLKDTEDDIICEMDDNHLFRIQAKGSEQKLRGLKWKNRRPGLIVGDDMENDEIVMNRDRRIKFKRWFYGALLPALSDKGKIRIVGTILHLDSLLENLMPSSLLSNVLNGHKSIIREDLKEYTNAKLPWKSIKYRAHTDDFKKLLWPEKKSAEEFKAAKADYSRQGLGDVYSQEMLNIPMDESDTFFRKADFNPMKVEDKKKKLVYYATCDLAVSQSQKADFSAFAVAGMDGDGKLFLVNMYKERLDSLGIIETVFMIQRIYAPVLFGFEKGTIQKAIGPVLSVEMQKQGVYINTVLIAPSQDKLTRARSIQARMRAGAVRFDKEGDWYQPFEEELLRFPRDKHDDQVDAMAYMGLLLDRMWEAPTVVEEEDEEYRLMMRRNAVDNNSGKSQVTGY